jgi:hypothetical protein
MVKYYKEENGKDYFFGGNNKNEANISHYHDNTI